MSHTILINIGVLIDSHIRDRNGKDVRGGIPTFVAYRLATFSKRQSEEINNDTSVYEEV